VDFLRFFFIFLLAFLSITGTLLGASVCDVLLMDLQLTVMHPVRHEGEVVVDDDDGLRGVLIGPFFNRAGGACCGGRHPATFEQDPQDCDGGHDDAAANADGVLSRDA
jgi:hypothetical protein